MPPVVCVEESDTIFDRFPASFKWGTISSAAQVEGAWNIDGRSMSWWDSSSRKSSGLSKDGSRANSTADSYHRFQEDVILLKSMNATCYKFSLSWSRILPDGTLNKINSAALNYYNDLINTLIENDIEPIVTLYHWDFPQSLLEKYPDNWLDDSVVKEFGKYARLCFKTFGDRVKKWLTVHDPWKHSEKAFGLGVHPPNFRGSSSRAFRNLLKAHRFVYRIYEKGFQGRQKGSIGFSINSKCVSQRNCMRMECAVPDYAACSEMPLSYNPNEVSSDFPNIWKDILDTPYDFIDLTNEDIYSEINSLSETSHTNHKGCGAADTRRVLNVIKEELGNPEVLLCGKGCPIVGVEISNLSDLNRVDCFKLHATEILKAVILDGCNVIGFLPGTLVDSWEWEFGYTLSYGLHQVKFDSPLKQRIQRASAKYLSKLFKMHGFSKHLDFN